MSKKRKLRVVGEPYEPNFLQPENKEELKAREKLNKDTGTLKDRDFGVDDENVKYVLRRDVGRIVPETAGVTHAPSRKRHDAALAMIELMGPRNMQEALLAAHIVMAHNLAADLAFHGSFGLNADPQERDTLLRSFQRLNSTMIRSMEALDKLQEKEVKRPEAAIDRSDDTIFTKEQVAEILGMNK